MKDIQKIKEFFSKPLNEEETAIDMAKKQLDQLGAKYEMSGNKFKPFKAIYKPIGKSDDWYDKFDEIVDLFNLGSAVKSSMSEASQAKIPYLPLSKKEVEILNSEGKVTKTFAGTGFSHRVDPKTVNTYLNATEVTYTDWNTGQRVKAPVDVEYSKQVGSISITVHSGKSMNEAQEDSLYKDWDQFEKPSKIKVYLNNGKTLEITPLKLKGGKRVYDAILQAFIDDRFDITNKVIQGMTNNLSEAKEEDKVDTITMDIPLFLRMLEYSREDAQKDLDLHDVTEKANLLGKERGILSMEDYNEIVGAAEEIEEGLNEAKGSKGDIVIYKDKNNKKIESKIVKVDVDENDPFSTYELENGDFVNVKDVIKINKAVKEAVNLKASKLSSAEYQKAKKLKDFKSSDWKWNADEDLYTKVNEAELTEANVPSNIKEFAKRKGVSSLVNKVAGWAERVGKRIAGGTAVGMNYSTLVLDLDYQQNGEIRINTDNETVTLYDEPVNSFPEFKSVYLDNKEEDNDLAERISEALDKINEELCPAGKAYIKRRKAAGEKSSAYLSGRAVKVCKGQMSGKAKKK